MHKVTYPENFVKKYYPKIITNDTQNLIAALKKKNINVIIMSGGIKELIIPFAKKLSISHKDIHAVEINWDELGNFKSINQKNGFYLSKVNGYRKIKPLEKKIIVIGDGFTDLQLFTEGFADTFIAYTEHTYRDRIIQKSHNTVSSMIELKRLFNSKYCIL